MNGSFHSVFRSLGLLVLWSLGPSVDAHEPHEIWTLAVVRADRLELGVTMAQSTALRLIDPELRAGALTFQNFEAHRPRLEKEAATLFVLTAGRNTLAAQRVDVQLTDENDVVFRIASPRPKAGRLHFHAAFLKKLGQGYGGILEVSDAAGDNIGWEQISWENPNFEVALTADKKPRRS